MEIFCLEPLIQLQNLISEMIGCSSSIINSTGIRISSDQNCSSLEKVFFQSSATGSFCQHLFAMAGLKAALDEKPVLFRFPFQLTQVAVPIILEKQYCGAVIIGTVQGWEEADCILDFSDLFQLNQFARELETEKIIDLVQLKRAAELVFLFLKQIVNQNRMKRTQEELEFSKMKLSIQEKKSHIALLQQGKATLEQMHMKYNPAFVYHVLNTISRLSLIENAPKTQEATITWYELHRYSSEVMGEMSTFGEEIENMKKYLKIQNIRFQNKFLSDLNYPKEAEDLNIPGTAILHLVEFLVLNDLYPKPEGGKIHLKAFYCPSYCTIQIWDDGVGFTEQELYRIQKGKYLEKEYNLSLFYQANQILIYFFGEYYKAELRSKKGQGAFIELKIPFMTREG